MTDLKATIARLLDILDQVEREIRRLDLWLNKHPVDAREHMDPVSYFAVLLFARATGNSEKRYFCRGIPSCHLMLPMILKTRLKSTP